MPQNILIINPFGIGDVLFSTPLIRNLRFYYPHAFIAVAVQKKVMPILENNPHINKLFAFSRGDLKDLSRQSKLKAMSLFFKTLSEIRRQRFDLCIDLSLEHRYSLFLKLLGVKQRIGFNYRKRGRFLTQRIDIEGYEGRHVAEYHLQLLEFLGKKAKFYDTELFLREEEREWAAAFLKDKGIADGDSVIGIIPGGGASWGGKANYLQWPFENFAGVCEELSKLSGVRIVLFGARQDSGICENISRILTHKPIEAFGRTTLRQFIALIDKCHLVICNDTGPLHISAALGKKIIYLCGPVDERVYGAYPPAPERIVMKRDFSCRPCYQKFRVPECNYQLRCLTAITAQEVLAQAKACLEAGAEKC
ncbi:glycosyltransferase family 9 protein [Candidatus Omnitrophota bacterium]